MKKRVQLRLGAKVRWQVAPQAPTVACDIRPATSPAPCARPAPLLQQRCQDQMTNVVSRFPIVGIGASAGGVEALQAFFRAMKQPLPMAFIVVTHLARGRLSSLPSIIADCTSLPIVPAEDGQKIESGHTYVLQSNAIITIQDGTIRLRAQPPDLKRERHPIDVFLASLAEDQQHCAIGIVLSGSGSDGTLGLKAIKTGGGLTMAQGANGTSPQYDDMPHSAISAGVVDLVVPSDQMVDRLAELSETFDDSSPHERLDDAAAAAAHATIAGLLKAGVGHDFAGYKDRTFFRRVQRRIHVLRLPGLEAYIARLRADLPGPADRRHQLLSRPRRLRRPRRARHSPAVRGTRGG
ncbi:chemotaxis protein CheB [Roseomonas sp. F4]